MSSPAVMYELDVRVSEEYTSKTTSKTLTQEVSDQELSALFTLIDRLGSLGYGITAVVSDPQLRGAVRDQLKYSRSAYEELLSRCRDAVTSYLTRLAGVISYRLSYVMQNVEDKALREVRAGEIRADLSRVQGLIQEASSATPQRLTSILDEAVSTHSKYQQAVIDVGALARDLASALTEVRSAVTDEEAGKSVDAYINTLQLISDRDALTDLLARFFLLMDVVRSDTYNNFMSAYRPYIEALIRVINNRATHDDLMKAVVGAQILLELKEKGALDVERFYPSGAETPELPSQYTFEAYYRRKVESITAGIIPAREPRAASQLADALATVDPSRHLWGAIYGSLIRFLPEDAAKYVATGATSSILSAVGTLVPPVGVAIAVVAVSDALADIGSRLTNPVDREAFTNFLQEHWQELLVNLAIGVAAGVGTGLTVAKLKPQIYGAVARVVERFSPSLAEKIRAVYEPKIVRGTPVYESKDYQIFVDKDTNTAFVRMYAEGKVQNVEVVNLKNAQALLTDPETATLVGEVIGKVRDPSMVGKLLTYLDDVTGRLGAEGVRHVLSELMNMSPSELRGVVTFGIKTPTPGTAVVSSGTKVAVVTDKGRVATLLTADVPDNEFMIYYLAEKGNIDTNAFINALIQAKKNPGHYEVFRQGALTVRAEGNVLKVYFGNDLVQIPLDAINAENLVRVANVLKGLKTALDPTTYNAVLDVLGAKAILTQPTSVVVSGVARLGHILKDVYMDVTKELLKEYGLEVRASDLVKVTTRVRDGTPVDITVSRQFLTSDQVNALIDVIRTRVFDASTVKEALKGLGFKEESIAAIKISAAGKYLPAGKTDITAVVNAIRNACSAGDAVAAQELLAVLTAMNLVGKGTASAILTAASRDGLVIAVAGAQAGIIAGVIDAAGKGDINTLTQLLVASGIPRPSAEEIASSITQVVTREGAKEVVVVPLTVTVVSPDTEEVVMPVATYVPEERYVVEEMTDLLIRIPVEVMVEESEEIVVPVTTYVPVEEEVSEEGVGRVVAITQEVHETITDVTFVDIVGEAPLEAPPPTQPSVTSVTPAPTAPPPAGAAEQTPGRARPRPRGRRELEEVSI